MADDVHSAVDPNVAQARILLASLWEHVEHTSHDIEAAEARLTRINPGSGPYQHHRQNAEKLRRELYETHRLIDGITGRYPETAARTSADGTA